MSPDFCDGDGVKQPPRLFLCDFILLDYMTGIKPRLFILRGKVKVNQYFSSPAAAGAKHSPNLNVFLCGCAVSVENNASKTKN